MEPCELEVADPKRLEVLPFEWAACGPGCWTTPAKVLASDDTVFETFTSAGVEGDDVVVRLGTMRGGSYYLMALRRLSDGAVLGAVRAPGPTKTACGFMGFAPSAPRLFPFMKGSSPDGGSSETATAVVGTIASGRLAWSAPILGVPIPLTSAFENELGWGMALDDGTLRGNFPSEDLAFSTIDRGTFPSRSTVGRGRLVVSNPEMPQSPDRVIRVWEPDHPSRTVVAMQDTGIPSVALSDTSLVWVGTHGPERRSGTYTAAELYWAASPAGRDSVSVLGSAALSVTSGLLSLQTEGDFAAVLGSYQPGKSAIFVVRLSDGHVVRLGPRPGTRTRAILAVSPSAVVVSEIDDSNDPRLAWQIQRLTRYELAKLDQLAAAW